MALSKTTEIARLADQLERSFRGGAWHGPATREVLARIEASTAQRRPDGSPHTILELVRHITFWVRAAYLRIGRGENVNSDGDWPEEQGVLGEDAWNEVIAELEKAYGDLHASLLELDDDRLDDAVPGADPTVRGLVLGTLQHNAYHTGQIVLIGRELGV